MLRSSDQQALLDRIELTRQSGHRNIIHISGSEVDCNKALTAALDCLGGLLPDHIFLDEHTGHKNQLNRLLGTESDILVVNAFKGFNPNAFGVATGTLRAGGCLILLSPETSAWSHFPDPDYSRMLTFEEDISRVKGHFIRHVQRIIANVDCVIAWNLPDHISIPEAPDNKKWAIDTHDQEKAVKAIKKVALGHAKRPLVITADRGRGKSAALGLAVADLVKEGKSVLVTAGQLSSLQTLFHFLAGKLGIDDQVVRDIHYQAGSVIFKPASEILDVEGEFNLLVVDEAASISTTLLGQALLRFNRIVFSSTVHGYEGNGRGFAVRFFKKLDKLMPQWKHLELEKPLRWKEGDPLEQMTLEMLLNTNTQLSENIELEDLDFISVSQDDISNDPGMLKEIFLLLVDAHYQTSPDDLRFLLDSPDASVFLARNHDSILAVCLVVDEGGFTGQELQVLLDDNRRYKGHILPQALLSDGYPEYLSKRFARVVRIAVLPEVRRQAVGKQLINYVEKHANVDFIGASFACEEDVLAFWRELGFFAVKLGLRQESTTADYSAVVIKPLGAEGLDDHVVHNFHHELVFQLPRFNQQIAPQVIAGLLQGNDARLESRHRFLLQAFASRQRSLEVALPALRVGLLEYLSGNVYIDAQLILAIRYILLQQTLEESIKGLNITGRKECESQLRDLCAKLLETDS